MRRIYLELRAEIDEDVSSPAEISEKWACALAGCLCRSAYAPVGVVVACLGEEKVADSVSSQKVGDKVAAARKPGANVPGVDSWPKRRVHRVCPSMLARVKAFRVIEAFKFNVSRKFPSAFT